MNVEAEFRKWLYNPEAHIRKPMKHVCSCGRTFVNVDGAIACEESGHPFRVVAEHGPIETRNPRLDLIEAKIQKIAAGLAMLGSIELVHKGPALSEIQREACRAMIEFGRAENS